MKKILTIEDEKVSRTLLMNVLKAQSFQAIGAENGRVGVELANEYQPDLILCDIMMPEMNGYEVLKALQENPKTATIPFIFLTGKTQRDDVRRGMQLGADDYLMKPFDLDELLGAIATRFKKKAILEKAMQSLLEKQQESSEAREDKKITSPWNLDKLYIDLGKVKQQQKTASRKLKLTSLEKACLHGLLNGYSPNDIAIQLNREPKGLAVDLSRGLYRYIESLTGQSPKNWRDIAVFLEKAGYRNNAIDVK